MTRRLPIFILLLLASFARAQSTTDNAPATGAAPATGPAPLATTAEVYAQIDAGQYRDALKNVLRILDLKGSLAATYNRAEMFLLRAECQLQLRQTAAALEALDAAAKEARANAANPQNADYAAKAWAFSALIAKSPNMNYTPKTRTGITPPKPISILDRTTRPAAYKALFDDTLPDLKTKVRAMATVATVPPMLDTAKAIATLRAIEKAGTGDVLESKLLAADLATRAGTLLSVSLGNMKNTVDTIAKNANSVYYTPIRQSNTVGGGTTINQIPHRRGLLNDEAAQLRNLQTTCNQIVSACGDLSLTLEAQDTFRPLASDADNLGLKIAHALNDDYSRLP